MSFVIRNNPFTVSANNAAPKRAPVTIDGEAVVEKTRPIKEDKNTAAGRNNYKPETNNYKAQAAQTAREARPEKYDEQLLGSQRILAARSPMAAFMQSSVSAPRLGSSIDTFA